MMKTKLIKIATSAAALSACLLTGLAYGQTETDAESFYKGKTIRWIVPYSPGGGYDKYSRLIVPFFAKYTGAEIRLDNKPGAGGMRGVNELFRSPNDGLTVGIINGSAMVTNQLAGIEGAKYKIEDFRFLGRVVADRRVLSVSMKSDYKTFDDLLAAKEEVKFGATGLGGSTYVDAVVNKEIFSLNQNLIHGFDSSSVIRQAMLRGNISAMWGSWGSAAKSVASGVNKVVLQTGKTRSADLSDAPTVLEMVDKLNVTDERRKILKTWQGLNDVGRPVAAPPGTPDNKIKFLRTAFEKALTDKDFIKKAADSRRAINFASGDEMDVIARNATVMDASVQKFFVSAIKGEL